MLIVTVWFLDAVYKFNVAYLTAERPDRSDRHDERPPEESKCKTVRSQWESSVCVLSRTYTFPSSSYSLFILYRQCCMTKRFASNSVLGHCQWRVCVCVLDGDVVSWQLQFYQLDLTGTCYI